MKQNSTDTYYCLTNHVDIVNTLPHTIWVYNGTNWMQL